MRFLAGCGPVFAILAGTTTAFSPLTSRPVGITQPRFKFGKKLQYAGSTGEVDCSSTSRHLALGVEPTTDHSSSGDKSKKPTLTTKNSDSDARIPISTNGRTENRFRRLKDMMWVRECLEDLTAAEFASTLDASPDSESQRRRKRAIDYDNLLDKLNRRIADLGCQDPGLEESSDNVPKLISGKGMGSIIYTDNERRELLKRILLTRRTLVETMKIRPEEDEEGQPFPIRLPDLPELQIPREEESSSSGGPKLYVRDDGTVDWDGALQDRAALKNLGTAVWARINGRNPTSVTEDSIEKEEAGVTEREVTVKIEETPAIRRERARLEALKDELKDMEAEHTALLNTALRAGQAVANINLATLGPKLRSRIQESASRLEQKKEAVSYQSLNFELERIYTYLAGELLGKPPGSAKGHIPLQDRLYVAEYGLLESQIEIFNQELETGESVDTDVLAVVVEQVADFKRRLGIDYLVAGFTFDREAIMRWLGDLVSKTRSGVAFYVKGCELFWNDIVYALTLIGRALQGYTLKPREVRNLRRTFKDIITFIPVVIILLIPLSPVGHVLVFGAIQRFFPDFFPSCFTESRQNLLQLYESTEYTEVTIDETLAEKLVRMSQAAGFFLMNLGRSAMGKVTDSISQEQSESITKGDDR